ncbi:MAG: hypothetical protein J6W81_05705 [Lentisphaeria bacterium]|nr:hypothetical protein [Lentisphaeria bacterium]
MKEDTVTIDDWDWCIDDESRLEPWFHIFREVEEKYTIKSNDATCVFRVGDMQKRSYFVKHFSPSTFKEHLIAFFSSKAKNIYECSRILHKAGIPCVQYPGWAKDGTESMTLSIEIPDTVTALEYWFRIAVHNTAKRREFVTNLANLLTGYVMASVVQRDLQLEHILVKSDGSEMFIVSPCDVEYIEGGLSDEEKQELLKPFVEIRGEVSPENISIALLEAGFSDNSMTITEMLHECIDAAEEELKDDDLPESMQYIMENESGPLCRVIEENENILRIRNTIWQTALPVPDDTNSHAEEISEEDAERIWKESFKAQILRFHCPRIPLSWETTADGRNIIRYATTEDAILACGFNQ